MLHDETYAGFNVFNGIYTELSPYDFDNVEALFVNNHQNYNDNYSIALYRLSLPFNWLFPQGLVQSFGHYFTDDDYYYTPYDLLFILDLPHNKELNTMSNAPIMSGELLRVKTYEDLMAVRSLTGIMRLTEHHLINGFSTYLKESTFTVRQLNDDDFFNLIAGLQKLGYTLEVRTNTARNKTINAYKVLNDILILAVVYTFDDNKLRYYGYCTTEHISGLNDTVSLIMPFVKEEPIIVNYVTGFSDEGVIIDNREITLGRNVPVDAFYPFIEEGIDDLAKNFVESNSNLLLLVGERGTGKTTLLREFCRKYKGGEIYQMCGDKVILHPAFDAYLAKLPEKSLIIIEDADAILGKRTDDNTSLSMLLNELDGIANKGSKFVITTNLENLKSVDSAVLRVGRCYKTIAFRKLTASEAVNAASAIGLTKTFDMECTLAEVFNGANQTLTAPVGFKL